MSSTQYRKKNRPPLDQIFKSILEGQELQSIDQIKRYGVADFFNDYDGWLADHVLTNETYIKAVKWYHNQKKRTRHG